MMEAMTKNGEELVEKLKKLNSVPVDVVECMGEVTQKVLVDAMFSGKIDPEWAHEVWKEANINLNYFCAGGLLMGQTINSLSLWPWTRAVYKTRSLLREKFQKLINDAVVKRNNDKSVLRNSDELEKSDGPTGDFIEYLVANGVNSDLIFEESLTMLFAGHDTTKNTLSWLFYFLGKDAKIMQSLQREIDEQLKGEIPSHENYQKLRGFKNAFMETLRMRPPAPALDRICGEEVIIDGKKILKDTYVYLYMYGALMDSKLWKNPAVFNPDRFEGDQLYTRNFVPFSVGTRNCIGQKFAMAEGVILGACILQSFDVYVTNKEHVPAVFEGTMLPKGLKCKFVERNKTTKF